MQSPDAFAVNEIPDILFSYDGSDLSLFLNGREQTHAYMLGAGTGLAQLICRVKPRELKGYNYIYLALVFLLEGFIVGIAARKIAAPKLAGSLLLTFSIFLPLALLEFLPTHFSGRSFSPPLLCLTFLVAIAGGLWINADRRLRD